MIYVLVLIYVMPWTTREVVKRIEKPVINVFATESQCLGAIADAADHPHRDDGSELLVWYCEPRTKP